MNKSKLTGILLSSAAVLTGAGVMHHAPAQAQQTQSNNHVVLAQRSADTNTSKTAVVIDGNGSLVLRAAASSGSAVSSYLSSGQMLTINSQSGAFYNVTVHETGATGYISANNLQIIENGTDDAFNALNEYGQVVNVSSSVHLRANASLNSSIIGFLQNGNTFKVLGKEGQWFKVDVDGTIGFIYQEYVSTSQENLAPVHTSSVNTNSKNTTIVNNTNSNNNTKTNNVTTKKAPVAKVQEKQEQTNTKATEQTKEVVNNENNKEAKANSETNKNVRPQAMSFLAINVNNNNNSNAQQSNNKSQAQQNNNNSNAQQNNNKSQAQQNNNKSQAQQNNNKSQAQQNNNKSQAQQNNNNSNAQQNNNNSNAQQNNNNSNAQQNNNNSNAQQNNNNSNAQQNNNNSNAQQNNNNSNAQQNNNSNSNNQVSNGNVTGQEIVNYAEQFLGRPYVWGATGPNAFDCSGLTSYVYRHFGYNIGRTTYTQVDQGTPVSLNNLQPGDLIFWGPASAPYHVAIYIGGGEYIQAPHPGENVDISSWNLNNISAARRIL
ncbi:SH3 domain-containing C40 family peptidase [Clostridium massiliamazoniense]|uniref:C40 family peptidase n=1 Tax=Clostridium massiliamazoniense TaxID=1347366 RepID=UPI0006D85AD3|nr:SH3 domain-containing C40 family peptidase [Clostridium massiliamazoniense]